MLTFPSACEGAGGDIYGVQHDLHRAMRVPQAVTTAWSATPLHPHTRVGVQNCSFIRFGAVDTLGPHHFGFQEGCQSLEKAGFSRLSHAQFPLPPTLHVYIGKYLTRNYITSSLF
jgi:hypothetical protein